jgi:hypothetical protein
MERRRQTRHHELQIVLLVYFAAALQLGLAQQAPPPTLDEILPGLRTISTTTISKSPIFSATNMWSHC